MRVCAFPADESACGAYRVTYPCQAAAGAVEVDLRRPCYPQSNIIGPLPCSLGVGDADVVFVHRPTYAAIVDELERLAADGHTIVVDIDDNLAEVLPEQAWHPDRLGELAAWCLDGKELARACEFADLVTVATPELKRVYGAHGRVQVLPNCVPQSLLELPRESDGHTIGWGGAAAAHPGDLPVTDGAIASVLDGWRFHVVGSAEKVRSELGLADEVTATGGLPLDAYHEALGALDIGIVPLADNPFNRCKSWHKGLQYAARGVAFVASALPEYRRLARRGAGTVVRTPKGWESRLSELMRDARLRKKVAARGLQVAQALTYEAQSEHWVRAWEKALQNRNRRLA